MTLDAETIHEIVHNELPRALYNDPTVRRAVWQLAREISPMVAPRADKVAHEPGIEVYSYAEDVKP